MLFPTSHPQCSALWCLGVPSPLCRAAATTFPVPTVLAGLGDLQPCLPSAEQWSSSFPDQHKTLLLGNHCMQPCCEAHCKGFNYVCLFLGLEGLPRPFPISCYFYRICFLMNPLFLYLWCKALFCRLHATATCLPRSPLPPDAVLPGHITVLSSE